MKIVRYTTLYLFLLPGHSSVVAQDTDHTCKVAMASLAGSYHGACKKGLANGEGDAMGVHHYTGFFKNGLPDGKGTYYFNDDYYFKGNFQDGMKEGKGELHFSRKNLSDSIIKGYWSGDEYRGNKYVTYSFKTSETFSNYEIIPTDQGGNLLTFELSTTTGAPDGTAVTLKGVNKSGFVLTITDIFSTNDCILTKLVTRSTTSKSVYSYTLSKFPANLFITLSNGRTIELDLYKAARWNVRLFLNQ